MNERDTEQRTAGEILREKQSRNRWLAVLLVLAVAVSAGTLWAFHYQGIAATYQKQVLDCHAVSGMVSHVHNDDCYRNGELVCPLEEIEPHQHTEACYTSVLFCGLEESEGHQHTEACFIPQMELVCGLEETDGDETHPSHHHTAECYAPVRELICGLEETPGDENHPAHWHTDECYQDVKLLICGMEEGEGAHHHTDACYEQVLTCEKPALPVHVHGPECFRMEEMTEEEIAAMNLADETPENIETTGTGPVEETVLAENYPEQHFKGEAAGLLVSVYAPSGAFPQNTEMVVSPIENEEILNAATAEVQGEVVLVQGVDISFFDAEGNEIEPLVPIQVEMVPSQESAGIIPDITEVSNEQTLVHVDSELAATVMEQEDNTTPEVRFESDSFSAYIIVYTKIETSVLASDGNNYKITVTAPDDAPFPENAKLWTSEIEAGANAYGVTYLEYLTKTEYALGWESGSTTYVRLFDIFVGDEFGNKLSLTTPVDVKIELLDKEAGTESSVVHFGTKTEVLASATEGQTVSFETSSLTVYAVAESTITQYVLASDGQNYKISLTYGPDAGIPDGAELVAKEVVSGETADGSMSYEDYAAKAERTLDENVRLTFARFFDITIMVDGAEFQPLAPVEVKIELAEAQDQASEDVKALHFYDDGGIRTIPTSVEEQTVSFNADGFSVYGIVGTQRITVDYLTADGKTLKITVTFDEKEVVPTGANLKITELSEEDDGWIERSLRLGEVLQDKYGYVVISDARFLDIKIKVGDEEFEPAEPVEVRVEYTEEFDTEYTYDYVNSELKPEETELGTKHFAMVHYVDNSADILESDITEGDGCIKESVSQTSSFSEYDIAYFTEDKLDDVDRSGDLPNLEIAGKSTSGVSTLGATRSAGDVPSHGKNLVNKGDGTYDIHLNVTGDADTTSEVSSVNVILVYDTSTSMNNAHNYGPYYVDTYTQNSTGRYGTDGNGNFFNLYYYSNTWPRGYRQLTNDSYTGTVYSNAQGTEYNGTRYSQTRTTRADVAEPVVRSFVNSLYSYQNPDDPTNIQTTFITFNGSANPRTSWTTSSGDITDYLVADGTMNSYNHAAGFYASGTNWEMALRAVETALSNKPDNDPTYVVFITDGAPTTSATITQSGTQYERCYTDARDEALAIQTAVNATGGDFYSIYAYGDETDWLATLMYYANNGVEPTSGRGTSFNTKGYYKASDTAALTSAISEIFDAIVDTLGITSVSIEDGTTSEVELSTGGGVTADLLDVNTDSFRYTLSWNVLSNGDGTYGFTMPDKVTGEDVAYTVSVNGENITITWADGSATFKGNIEINVLTVEWTESTNFYKFSPPAAQFVDPDVTWNLNGLGTLLSGVTYDVAFECYPTQYTLDLIADLKNGYVEYDSLDANIKQYLTKDGDGYVLATNTGATLRYTDTRTEDGPKESQYTNPPPQSTAATKTIAVSKDWSNAIDSREKPESLTMHVTRDGVDRYELILNDADNWTDNAFISYGIMTIHEGNIVLKTTGHDYSFSEPPDMEYYWELQAPTLRPMLINTVETLLVKVDESEAPAMSGENATAVGADGYTYYKLTINGTAEYYKHDEAVAHLQAENHRRSYLDVVKTVTGTNIPEDDVFPFTITVTNSNAASGTAGDLNSDYWVWFSVYDTINGATVISDDLVSGTGINRETNASGYTGYYYAPSGTEISVNMQKGYSLRFLNLPAGSTYVVAEETIGAESSYSFVDIEKTRSYKEAKDGPWIVDPNYTQTNTESQTISGIIELPDSAYKAEVTNKYKTVDIQLKKVDESGNVISGSIFDLNKFGTSWTNVQTGIKPGDTATSTANPVDLGGLGVGRYRLTETKAPDGYIIITKHIYFEVYKDSSDGSLKARLTDENGNAIESPTDVAAIDGPGTGDTPVYTITVTNTPGVELPQTGGPGAELFEAIGGIMMALAFAVMVIRKRKIA